jgi:hypothetical protein
VPRFVPNSGTLQRIPGHEGYSEGPRRARRKSLLTLTGPFFGRGRAAGGLVSGEASS